jgi:hypothetical protein
MSDDFEEPGASIVISARNNDFAQALGKVVGNALQEVGFQHVKVTHSDEEGAEPVEQTDLEQGKSLLDAIADANPDLFRQPISIHSFTVDTDTDLLTAEEAENFAHAIDADDVGEDVD